ncbi:MAG: hypothetical protein ACTSQI_06785 [Candidatus Helarchaeota archaeon]
MSHQKRVILGFLVFLFLVGLVPSKTVALTPPSFDQEVTDYFFLKFTDVNNATSAVSGFPIPPTGTDWMVEIDVADNSTAWDIVNGSVYQDDGDEYGIVWNQSTWFGTDSFNFGRYNGIDFQIGPVMENNFPVPFVVPLNTTPVETTLNQSLCKTFQNYIYINQTFLAEMMNSSGMGGMLPFSLFAIVFAWNGTPYYFGPESNSPNGTVTGDILIAAVYFGDGELNFLRESWWDNTTRQWNTMYQVVSPFWDAFGGMLEQLIPGTIPSSMMIPGFPYAITIMGLVMVLIIPSLKKPKEALLQ